MQYGLAEVKEMSTSITRSALCLMLSLFLWALMIEPAAAQQLVVGAFPDTTRLDAQLKRGASTKTDVERLLGLPSGQGGALLPPQHKTHEIWYYEEQQIKKITGEGRGVLRLDFQQRILLVFFEKGVFDGYIWFSNIGIITEK